MQRIKKIKTFSLASLIGVSILSNLVPINVQANGISELPLKEYNRKINPQENPLNENYTVNLNIEITIDELGIAQKAGKIIKNTQITNFFHKFQVIVII